MDKTYEIAVVGGGIAGYTAALTAKNLLLDYLWLAGGPLGGKASAAETVRNVPGFTGTGKELAAALARQCAREGVVRTERRADGVYRTGDGYRIAAGETTYSARTVVLATGVETASTLKGEREFAGRGVSYCAVCDGALYRGKTVAAVLSSPGFEADAAYLARYAARVHCFCLYRDHALAGENLILETGTPVAVEGGARAERLVLADGSRLPVDGVFLLKEAAPPQVLVGGLKSADGIHAETGRGGATNLPGLFAAGDVAGGPYQFAKAAGEGLAAAYAARDYLRGKMSR